MPANPLKEEKPNYKTIHEEIGIEDKGAKRTKISAAIQLARVHERIDSLTENNLVDIQIDIKDLYSKINKNTAKDTDRHCKQTTFEAETNKTLLLHSSVLSDIVAALVNARIYCPIAPESGGPIIEASESNFS